MAVKGTESVVLPSKALHLLLPGLVPAYDQARIQDEVLPRAVGPDVANYGTYLKLSWWVLHELRRSGELDRALQTTKQNLLDQLKTQWPAAIVRGTSDLLDYPVLDRLDTCLSEYVLMGMTGVGAEGVRSQQGAPLLERGR